MPDNAQMNREAAPGGIAETTDAPETSFSQVNERLKEIVAAVEDDNLPLDDALSLFEEAVSLGMKASSLLEQDLHEEEEEDSEQAQDGE